MLCSVYHIAIMPTINTNIVNPIIISSPNGFEGASNIPLN